MGTTNFGALVLLMVLTVNCALVDRPKAFGHGVESNRFKRVDGTEAVPHSSPWLGYLEMLYCRCGAFLINLNDDARDLDVEEGSSDIALTAAHCVGGFGYQRPEKLLISFGKHDSAAENETEQIDVKVMKAISHREYHVESRHNDIAMLKLEKPVKFNKFVRPIKLSNFTLNELDHCFISGWGGTKKLGIQYINVDHLIEHESLIAIDQIKQVQKDDSGGPLICSKGSYYVAQGIASGSTNDNKILKFVNIVNKRDWISETYDEIESPMNYHPKLMRYSNVKTYDKSMLDKILNHYIAGVFGYVPESLETRLNLIVDYEQYGKRWLEPEFYKHINVENDKFYVRGIIGYEIVHNASTCAVLCVDKNHGRICSYLLTTKRCYFSVESNYQLNAAAKMPYYQSLIIHTHSKDIVPSKSPGILSRSNRVPNLELFRPNWNVSISTTKSPMFHCTGQIWRRDESENKRGHTILESPKCTTMLVSEYNGYLYMSVIDLNSQKKIRSDFQYIRPSNSRWNYHRISQLNYTIEEYPTFRSYNPLLGSFLAEPNTMPWMVSLTEGYAVLLNESEISGIGRKDRTRFVLTTCNCQQQT